MTLPNEVVNHNVPTGVIVENPAVRINVIMLEEETDSVTPSLVADLIQEHIEELRD